MWSAIDTSRKYRIVTNNFLSTGKDGYKEFSDIKWTDTYIDYHDPIAHFIEGLSEQDLKVSKLPKEEYSIKSFIDPDGCNHSIYDDCMYTW
jgi:5'-nucleotidase/UDP-sugar diphosphatase